jgi:hypothetical protein
MNYSEITNLPIIQTNHIETPFNKVFSTNVFLPMEMNISHKTFSYLTGFIKLVETFKLQTNWNEGNPENNWGLLVFYDKSLSDFVYSSHYRTRKSNTPTNTRIKTNYKKNKDIIDKLYEAYRCYINIIITDKEKYNFIKLYSYTDNRIVLGKKGYSGLPSTYGSFIRFIPLYDDTIRQFFCINISHPITFKLMELIYQWNKTSFKLVSIDHETYRWINIIKLKIKIDKIIINLKLPREKIEGLQARIPAGLFGFNKDKKTPEFPEFTEIDNFFTNGLLTELVKKYNSKESINRDIFNYGIDEILLRYVLEKYNNNNFYAYNDDFVFPINTKLVIETLFEKFIKKIPEKILIPPNLINYISGSFTPYKIIFNENINESIIEEINEFIRGLYLNNYQLEESFQVEIYNEELGSSTSNISNLLHINKYNEKYGNLIRKLELPHLYRHLNFLIDNIPSDHIYLSINFVNLLPDKLIKDIKKYFKKKENYGFKSLMESLNEDKPIILFSEKLFNNSQIYPFFYTYIKIEDYPNNKSIKILINELIDYYENLDLKHFIYITEEKNNNVLQINQYSKRVRSLNNTHNSNTTSNNSPTEQEEPPNFIFPRKYKTSEGRAQKRQNFIKQGNPNFRGLNNNRFENNTTNYLNRRRLGITRGVDYLPSILQTKTKQSKTKQSKKKQSKTKQSKKKQTQVV